jgi:hypothetical protein
MCRFVILYSYVGTTDVRIRSLIRDKMATDKIRGNGLYFSLSHPAIDVSC